MHCFPKCAVLQYIARVSAPLGIIRRLTVCCSCVCVCVCDMCVRACARVSVDTGSLGVGCLHVLPCVIGVHLWHGHLTSLGGQRQNFKNHEHGLPACLRHERTSSPPMLGAQPVCARSTRSCLRARVVPMLPQGLVAWGAKACPTPCLQANSVAKSTDARGYRSTSLLVSGSCMFTNTVNR